MNWLLISILSNAGLFLIFKKINHSKINVLSVIVINYITCFVLGNSLPGHATVFSSTVWNTAWFLPVSAMGLLFIAGFYSMGTATGKAGAAATSVASKMSVVIPAVISIILFKEKLNAWQYIGIGISLFSVFLMVEPISKKRLHKGLWLLVLVFFTSGAVDTGLNLVGNLYGKITDPFVTSTCMFGMAGFVGSVVLLRQQKGIRFKRTELMAGIILGVINFISLVAMLSGITDFTGRTAWFFAVNNIGVVVVSSILSMVIFKEKLHRSGYIGLFLAILAILFMNTNAFF